VRIGLDTFAVIAGGAGGIGSAVASELSSRGASLALIDVDLRRLEAVGAALPRCTIHQCDITNVQAVELLARTFVKSQRAPMILINSAGISVAGEIGALPREQFERCMAVNFWGVVNTCQAFLPQLRIATQQGGASAICNVLSDFALLSLPTKAAYAASKHACRAFTEGLGAELHGTRIRVISAYVGATATDFVQRGYATSKSKQQLEASFLARGMKTTVVAKRIVAAIEKNRSRVLIGADAGLIDAATRFSPALVQFATRRLWRRIQFL
jgi:short-subunit dehydrogenase